ncbi:MAG: hypothetical protein WB421_14070 [Terriglobales bacterium]
MSSLLIAFILGAFCAVVGSIRLLAVRSVAVKLSKALAAWHGFASKIEGQKTPRVEGVNAFSTQKRAAKRNIPASLPVSPDVQDVADALAVLGAPKASALLWARDAAAALPGASFDVLFRKAAEIRSSTLAGVVARSQTVPA